MTAVVPLLLIDDDVELGNLLQRFMADEGYRLDIASNGRDGIRQALGGPFELIVLDVMMPGCNGFDVLRSIRSESRTPVLMLTAKGDTRDRVRGLELGADDYLPKPFDPTELLARIRAVLRRVPHKSVTIQVGDISLDAGTRAVRVRGEAVDLTTVEFDLLATLLHSAGTAIARPELVRGVLGRVFSPFDRSIDTHIYNLRKKLGPHSDGAERIKSLRGSGYLYTCQEG